MSLLSQFYLGSPPSLYQYDCLEIIHPNFTQTYRIVRNRGEGLVVTHEGPAGPFTYEYYPATVKPVGSSSDMNQSLQITLGDLGNVIQKEIAVLTQLNKMNIRPTLKMRTYRSDDLTQPMFGPLILEISKVTCSAEGNSFEAHPPRINHVQTGTRYTKEQFPMIAGFF